MASVSKITTKQEPVKWDMVLYRGDTWPSYTFTIKDGAGDPRDLSTASILMQVREDATSSVKKTLTHTDGFTVGGTGNATVAFDTEVDLQVGKYVADIQITYSTGEVKTYFSLTIDVKQDVSRV